MKKIQNILNYYNKRCIHKHNQITLTLMDDPHTIQTKYETNLSEQLTESTKIITCKTLVTKQNSTETITP